MASTPILSATANHEANKSLIKPAVRKRKTHRNSRLGCANCKIRNIKCDEAKPSCKPCHSFGVRCLYGSSRKLSSDVLSLDAEASFKVSFAPALAQSPAAPLPMLETLSGSETYQLSPADVPLIEKFQFCTVLTLGSENTRPVYVGRILSLAFSDPTVMHVILALTHLHFSTFNPLSQAQDKISFAYHWYHAASSLKRKISLPIKPSERDSLWISISLISVASFATFDAPSPSEAWPLRPSSPTDLSWLILCDGKKMATKLTDPLRPDGQFRDAAQEFYTTISLLAEEVNTSPSTSPPLLPPGFHELFNLSSQPSDSNPYHAACTALASILRIPLNVKNFLPHIAFVSVLDDRFRNLLRRKDERALLLLLYWYAKICNRRLWWIWKQSLMEGLAICEFLRRAWKTRPDLIQLLVWPAEQLRVAS